MKKSGYVSATEQTPTPRHTNVQTWSSHRQLSDSNLPVNTEKANEIKLFWRLSETKVDRNLHLVYLSFSKPQDSLIIC